VDKDVVVTHKDNKRERNPLLSQTGDYTKRKQKEKRNSILGPKGGCTNRNGKETDSWVRNRDWTRIPLRRESHLWGPSVKFCWM